MRQFNNGCCGGATSTKFRNNHSFLFEKHSFLLLRL